MYFLLMIPLTDDGYYSRGLGSDKSVDGRVVAFSNKSFAQTSSIVLANIATWVLSTHVVIRGRAYLFRLIRPIIIPNTPNNPCQLPSQSDIQLLTLQPILVCFIKLQ